MFTGCLTRVKSEENFEVLIACNTGKHVKMQETLLDARLLSININSSSAGIWAQFAIVISIGLYNVFPNAAEG